MALRPSTKPRFATVNYNNGPLSGPNVTEPSELIKDKGWEAGEKPPREYFNWLHRLYYQWIDYLDELALNSLQKSNNLSDLSNVASARTNLGLGTAATLNSGTGATNLITTGSADARYLRISNNLSDLGNITTARSSLGLGTAAVLNTGTSSGDIPTIALADTRYVNSSGDTMTGNLTVPDGTVSGHAINLGQADSRYINAAGDTMTGALILTDATAGTHAMNRNTSDGRYIQKSGDTMTGALNVVDATSDTHALNRQTADARYIQTLPSATDTVAGVLQIADIAEVTARASNSVALTPANIQVMFPSETQRGLPLMASNANSNAGGFTGDYITPANFGSQQLKATNGYQRLPGGIIMQWGTTGLLDSEAGASAVISLPIAFPTACLNIQATIKTNVAIPSGIANVYAELVNASQIRLQMDAYSNGYSFNVMWFAIGH